MGEFISKSLLPDEGTENWEKLKEEYPTATFSRLNELAITLGFQNRASFMRAIRDRGLYRQNPSRGYPDKKEEPERHPVVELPPVEFHKYTNPTPRRKGDEEIAILHITDGHAGKITSSFNDDVYKDRVEQVYHKTMLIVNLHRNIYPIHKLVILCTGDNVQGENPSQGSRLGETSMGARDQVKKLASPTLNNLIGSFKQEFKEVDFHGVPGNHGHEKLAPETSNYDLLLYDILEAGIGQNKGINIFCHEQWYALEEINGHKCFMFHGDGIPCQQGVPFFALDRKLKSWYMLHPFRYAFSGHFHKAYYNEVSNVLEHFMAASLVSDDEWVQKKLGIASSPSQNIYGIHPRQGITWKYKLTLA